VNKPFMPAPANMKLGSRKLSFGDVEYRPTASSPSKADADEARVPKTLNGLVEMAIKAPPSTAYPKELDIVRLGLVLHLVLNYCFQKFGTLVFQVGAVNRRFGAAYKSCASIASKDDTTLLVRAKDGPSLHPTISSEEKVLGRRCRHGAHDGMWSFGAGGAGGSFRAVGCCAILLALRAGGACASGRVFWGK
jgi:hypothetical protein